MAKKNCNNILAEGETTGHQHRVTVQVMEREDGVREFEGATVVEHEEHRTITLPARKWNSDKVLELEDATNQMIRVQD